MIEIKGIVERIIYRNDENGYTVAKLVTEDDTITITGSCLSINTSMEYEFKGDFTYHKKYGEQFVFQSMFEILPESEEGIISYLSSGIIPYIGEKMAKAIVEKYKTDTLRILDEEPNKLLDVNGIGPAKLEKIKQGLEENKGLRRVILFFNKYQIDNKTIVKIFKEYGENAIDIVRENPYRLAEDIRGIGFKKADQIARNMGDFDPAFRKRAVLKYTLTLATLEGHSFLPKDELISRTKMIVNYTSEELEEEINNLNLDDRFIIEKTGDETNCYYAPYLRAENYISGKINSMLNRERKETSNIEDLILKVENTQGIKFAQNQKRAVEESLKRGVLIITGGPGTGKTTTLKAIIEVSELMELKVKLAAPTGRAAKRMKEATLRDASTIHKLLELGFANDESINYGYEETAEVDCDVLIIDEVSMVDLPLMNTLLHSLNETTRLILVGDKDQLPSVGVGNVLGDLIDSGVIPTVNLNEIFRQAETSMIVKNAHLINNGKLPEIKNDQDFFMISEFTEAKTSEIIVDLVSNRLPGYYGINASDIQVLTPMKKGIVGVNNLNKSLQNTLNPKDEEIEYGDTVFRVGDKVMQIKNNYTIEYTIESDEYVEDGEGVFNGDIGYITSIDKEERTVTVLFDEVKSVKYEGADLEELVLAYACTIHKSQGSEFEAVVIPVHFAPYMLLTRNLIYTAITRAKRLVVLVGNYKYLKMMIDNNKVSKRYSNLAKKLVVYNV